ncbi:MAG: RNase adapter RapZ [Bdellovibrionales bacterium]|nr:RNase adapter RapZ [Bdellovibrionales bacterium]
MPETELIIISGISGSGKSTALKAFEDMGYLCVDNLPAPLISHFIDYLLRQAGALQPGGATASLGLPDVGVKRVALLMDCREDRFFAQLKEGIERLKAKGIRVSLLFFDCQDEVVVRRFRETRRPHPLMLSGSLSRTITEALVKERELLADFRQAADRVIDTSAYTVHDLRRAVEQYCGRRSKLEVYLTSFGYKYGAPYEADLLLDVRFLPNPHFVPELKPSTGLEEPVANYVFQSADAQELLHRYTELLAFLIPRYEAEGKRYLTVGIGCTGGRHRSVAIVERLHTELKGKGIPCSIIHRDLDRDLRR